MTEAQRVTFVSHTNKPGGGELALRRYLDATTLPVRLVTLQGEGVWAGLTADVVEVEGVRGLARALRGERLVVANSMRSAFLTALVLHRRARLVYWVRDGLTDSAMSQFALALTKHVTARRASHYLANSRWTAKTVQEAMKVGAEHVDVIHSMCGNNAPSRRPGPTHPQSPPRLLFLGRIAPWKAPHVAIHSIKLLRQEGIEATLTVVGGVHFGEEKYAADVRRLVEEEPAITMMGHVDNVQSLLAEHDVLLHCSTTPEPFGQILIQGLAAGMPVVATNAGGPREILQGPFPLLYEPGSAAALATAVRYTLDHYPEILPWCTARAMEYTDARALAATDRAMTNQLACLS